MKKVQKTNRKRDLHLMNWEQRDNENEDDYEDRLEDWESWLDNLND